MFHFESIIGLIMITSITVFKLRSRHLLKHRDRMAVPIAWREQAFARQSEMEALLGKVHTAAEKLVRALETEAGINRRLDGSPGTLELLPQFIEARQALVEAQNNYDLANDEYRQFVASLPPVSRPMAARRGELAVSGA
jgi:hypothetical protein